MEYLLEPLSYQFFRHALLAALLVGLLGGLLGVYIVLRGMSYIGHGLSHAAFGGAVVGYLLNIHIYVGAVVMSGLAALLIHRLGAVRRVKVDAAIGIITAAAFALGVVLISREGRFMQSFEAALFGDLLAVTSAELWIIVAVLLLTVGVVVLAYRPLLFTTFDAASALAFGIPSARIQLWFSLLLALGVVASMNLVGVTLIAAALIIPGVTARLLTDGFHRLLLLAPAIGGFMGVGGLFFSYYLNAASGATIVLFGMALFALAWLYRIWRDRYVTHIHPHRHGDTLHAHPHSHDGDHAHSHDDHEH